MAKLTNRPRYPGIKKLPWVTRKRNGIMNLPEARKAGLSTSDKAIMMDQLKRLYSWDFLGGLNDEQIFDLFEEKILLPGLAHIKHKKPVKPRPDSSIYDLPIEDQWWLIRPDPKPEEEEET